MLSFPGFYGCITVKWWHFLNLPDCSTCSYTSLHFCNFLFYFEVLSLCVIFCYSFPPFVCFPPFLLLTCVLLVNHLLIQVLVFPFFFVISSVLFCPCVPLSHLPFVYFRFFVPGSVCYFWFVLCFGFVSCISLILSSRLCCYGQDVFVFPAICYSSSLFIDNDLPAFVSEFGSPLFNFDTDSHSHIIVHYRYQGIW